MREILKKIGWSEGILETHSLPELLAEKKFCEAVWGVEKNAINPYEWYSGQAFEILQQESEEAAITYIKSTML